MSAAKYDVLVLGSGPAGQKAAIQAAKAGRRVAIIERERLAGGACLHRGTIPSKTLREVALQVTRVRQMAGSLQMDLRHGNEIPAMMSQLDQVIEGNVRAITAQLERNGVELFRGRARFLSPNDVEVQSVRGANQQLRGDWIVIAVGSRPREPAGIEVDHEHILDSDSILSMAYLPQSLAVLGGGVVACEYACMFARLGVRVTLIDTRDRPLPFMDPELTEVLVQSFERTGSTYMPGQRVQRASFDGVGVEIELQSGQTVRTDKCLQCLGRVANVERLGLEAAGIEPNARGLLDVEIHGQTSVPHIYAVGDVIGPPALASTSMEQGRRAVRHALGLPESGKPEHVPAGIFTIPAMACVGLTAAQAAEQYGGATVGVARFDEVARGLISGATEGMLKLVADPAGETLLGVHVVGDGAPDLIHVGQMAMMAGLSVESFVDDVFNFPTLAEAYRIAALDLVNRRAHKAKQAS